MPSSPKRSQTFAGAALFTGSALLAAFVACSSSPSPGNPDGGTGDDSGLPSSFSGSPSGGSGSGSSIAGGPGSGSPGSSGSSGSAGSSGAPGSSAGSSPSSGSSGGPASGGASSGSSRSGGTGSSGSGGSRDAGGAGSGSSSGGSSSGGASGPDAAAPVCNPPTSGTDGFTTRFWDCCKPSCSWPKNAGGTPAISCNAQNQTTDPNAQSACGSGGGSAYACYSFAPWAADATTAYGFAAFDGGNCGDCYELDFTGQSNNGGPPDPGSASLCGKKMIVQAVNIGAIAQGKQFDLMIPGGGVGQNTSTCPSQWNATPSALGMVNGGILGQCQSQNPGNYQAQLTCTKNMCASLFSSSNEADLLKGCNWVVDWFGGASNPTVKFTKVTCPSQLTSVSMLN